MVTMTVYVNTEVFCNIVNGLNESLIFEEHTLEEVSLKETKRFPYEIQVPIQIIGRFAKKNRTTIDIKQMVYLNSQYKQKI